MALFARMTSIHRERVLKAFHGGVADRVPRGEFLIADEFARAFLDLGVSAAGDASETGAASAAGDPSRTVEFHHYHSIVESLDLDIASVPLSAGWGALEPLDQDRALDLILQWVAESAHFVFALIDGPFSAAVRARGLSALLHYVGGAPHVARDLFRRGADETRVAARAVRDAGVDGVILGEDMAYGRSTYLSPADLRDLYWAELAAVARELRALGLVVLFHSDGNLNAVLPDLARCGLDGIQGLEPEAGMEINVVRSQVGPDMTLWGNLGFEFLSAPRTDEEIKAALRPLPLPPASPPGKFILGSSTGLVQGLNVETVRRVYARHV
jgi:uroporphyrinogen decarboxylase